MDRPGRFSWPCSQFTFCNKVNGKVHATTNEIPFARLKKEGLSPPQAGTKRLPQLVRRQSREEPNRNPTKWFRFGEEGQRSGVSHTRKGVASKAKFVPTRQSWPSITCWQRIMRGSKSLCTGYRTWRLTLKQTMDAENVLLEQGKVIDFPLKPSDLSRYGEVLYA